MHIFYCVSLFTRLFKQLLLLPSKKQVKQSSCQKHTFSYVLKFPHFKIICSMMGKKQQSSSLNFRDASNSIAIKGASQATIMSKTHVFICNFTFQNLQHDSKEATIIFTELQGHIETALGSLSGIEVVISLKSRSLCLERLSTCAIDIYISLNPIKANSRMLVILQQLDPLKTN